MNNQQTALRLALEALEYWDVHGKLHQPTEEAITAIKQALEQPVQEPVALEMDGKQLTLGEALDEAIAATERSASKRLNTVLVAAKNAIYTPPPAQPAPVQPVAMRMPKVGDKVVCIEDESFGTVVYLTAGGSPEIKFDDGSHGTYMLREFAELFGYTTPPAQPAPVHPDSARIDWLTNNPLDALDIFGHVKGSDAVRWIRQEIDNAMLKKDGATHD